MKEWRLQSKQEEEEKLEKQVESGRMVVVAVVEWTEEKDW